MEVVVLKLGGASLQNLETLKSLSLMLKDLLQSGVRPVIIHGGGPAINEELTRRGISWTFINGQRQTTPEMMEVIEEVG
jgi:acetylglutamate kinase